MKNLLLLAAFTVFFADTLPGQSPADEYAMQIFARELMAAYNRQDITALRAMYTRDVVGDSLYHRDHIAKTFEDVFTRQEVTVFVRQIGVTWSDAEQALVATGTYEGHGVKIPYGDSLNWKVAYRNTMVQDSGRWKIARSVRTDVVKVAVQQKTTSVADWKSALTNVLQGSGVLTVETGTAQDDPNLAYALLEWPSMEVAKAFFEKPDWYKTLPKGRGDAKPTVVFLNNK